MLFITVSIKFFALLAPAGLFLVASWICFWKIPQGKDILIDMLEKKHMGGIILLSLLFFALVSWYSSRILVYRKNNLFLQNSQFGFHIPRIIGYLSFSVVWIALLKLPEDAYLSFQIYDWVSWFWLFISIVFYFIWFQFFKFIRDKKIQITDLALSNDKKKASEKKRFNNVFKATGFIVLLILILNSIFKNEHTNAWIFFISVCLLQIIFLFIVVVRRGRIITNENIESTMPLQYPSIESWQEAEASNGNKFSIGIWERMLYNANIPENEKWFFVWYNIITALSLIVYFITIFSYGFSVLLGSFATVLISFAVLVGFFSLISFASIVQKVNFHIVIWILIFVVGKILEPHGVKLVPSQKNNPVPFDNRPYLDKYFDNWVEQRKSEIETVENYPVFFVLADGGASRSGYWTASVLGKLEDTTGGKFSKHLFCLSGASGGSVGNGSFLALLKYKNELKASNQNYCDASQDFLRSDFLTYTLARTLGPDFFRPMMPLPFVNDRAAALENAIEKGNPSFLSGKFGCSTTISTLIPFSKGNEWLPMICINATRMQDGRPSVVSTVALDSNTFGKRIDILKTLSRGEDMKLSTAVVLGARFPYLSPAGRIGNSYYVDGGYFDNSGAGIVNEMIIHLREYMDSLKIEKPYLQHLRFYIIHTQNGSTDSSSIKKVHPVINDLAAPLLTLIGSYGTQTSVNDWRLLKYMEAIYKNKNDKGYMPVNLYSPLINGSNNKQEFPMDWVISKFYLDQMNGQLKNVDMQNLVEWINYRLR